MELVRRLREQLAFAAATETWCRQTTIGGRIEKVGA
jgi:hypothetical protein